MQMLYAILWGVIGIAVGQAVIGGAFLLLRLHERLDRSRNSELISSDPVLREYTTRKV
jgi:hypothetical protein